jgi:serine/threonine protein kinase
MPCFGITQNPDTKNYMMVLVYCEDGDLRNYLNKHENYNYVKKIKKLSQIAGGLLDIHNAGKIHKDFHPGNILFFKRLMFISDLGLCQPANNEKQKGVYGVLPYVAPEVLCGSQYTKAADIYSFGIIMNEFISEEIPYSDIPYDYVLTVNIFQGLRPKISEDTPKLLADLIMKCWDAKAENRPTAKELYQILKKWYSECGGGGDYDDSSSDELDNNSEIYAQIKECEKIRKSKLKNRSDKDKPQTHPQAIYTSRLLNFKNLPEPVNSSDLSSIQYNPGNI